MLLKNLKHTRLSRLMTQRELAAKAGVSPTTVNRLETQEQPAEIRTIRKLAAALDVEAEQLIGATP